MIKKLHITDPNNQRNQDLFKYINSTNDLTKSLKDWFQGYLHDKVSTIEESWNENIATLAKWFVEDYKQKHGKYPEYLDGNHLFLNRNKKEKTIAEELWSIHILLQSLEIEHSNMDNQTSSIRAFSPAEDFLDLTDTPSTYTGSADLNVGVWGTDQSLSFIKAGTVTKFLDLTDTLSAYPVTPSPMFVDSAGSTIEAGSFKETLRWTMTDYSATAVISSTTLSGTQLENTYWSLDIDDVVSCTNFEIILDSATYDGAQVVFKVTNGETAGDKIISPSGSVTFQLGATPSYELANGVAVMLIYDTANATYYKMEGHTP